MLSLGLSGLGFKGG